MNVVQCGPPTYDLPWQPRLVPWHLSAAMTLSGAFIMTTKDGMNTIAFKLEVDGTPGSSQVKSFRIAVTRRIPERATQSKDSKISKRTRDSTKNGCH